MSTRAWLLAAMLGVALQHGEARAQGAIDLNSAGVAELEKLPGIGPKKAEAIVALRQKRPFTRVTQLLEVRGIGRKTLERLRALVLVRTPGAHGQAVQGATLGARTEGEGAVAKAGEVAPAL